MTETIYRVDVNEMPAARVEVSEVRNLISVDEDNLERVSVALASPVVLPTDLLAVWAHPDTLSVRTGNGRFYFPVAAKLVGVSLTVGTAPVGDDVVADVNRNDTSIFSDQNDRPRILDGEIVSGETLISDEWWIAAGDYLSVDLDQVGSNDPGHDLTVTVRYRLV